MPFLLKHIIRLLLLVLLMGHFISCQSWREAKATVAEADGLLANGVIMRDTAVLAAAISALDNHFGRVFAREELAKAYYLMGRNLDDYHHNFSDAADCYIEADRLKTKDLILRGRINSCMGYLCKQDSCFEEALVFYERSSKSFKTSGNEWYYAHNLLNVAEQYVNLQEYEKVDSILQLASTYEIDSAYYASLIDIKSLKLYNQQMYDSALVCLLSIKDYPRNVEERCFSAHQTLQCYCKTCRLDFAVGYAEYIIAKSSNASFRSNAYYVLIRYAEMCGAVDSLAYYSYLREDEDRIVQQNTKAYAEAIPKLTNYIFNPYPFRIWKMVLFVVGILIGITIFGWGIGSKKNQELVMEKRIMEVELVKWKEQIQQTLDKEKVSVTERREVIKNIIMEYSDDFAIGNSIWKNENELFRLANSSFGFVLYRLKHKYHLNNRELKICLMELLGFSNKDIAKMVFYAEDSYPTIKRRLARKLDISAGEMREFLMDFILKIT